MWEAASLMVCLCLTMFSTSVLIFYFCFQNHARTYAFKLVLMIFVFDFIWSLNVFIPLLLQFISPEMQITPDMCRLQGVVKLFSTLASFITSLTISYTLFRFLIRQNPIKTKNPILYFAPYTIILPFLMALLPLILDRYGNIEPFKDIMCFIILKSDSDWLGIALRTGVFYLPYLLILFLDIYYVSRICYDYYHSKSLHQESYPREVRNLVLYPMILLLSWMWIMAERILEAVNGGHQIGWLQSIDLQGASINGFLNSLVYGYLSINPFSICFGRNDNSNLNSELLQSKDSLLNNQSVVRRDQYYNNTSNHTSNNSNNINPATNNQLKSDIRSDSGNSMRIVLREDNNFNNQYSS